MRAVSRRGRRRCALWPRKPVEPFKPQPDDTAGGDTGTPTDGGSGATPDTAPVGGRPVGTVPGSFTTEGLLREALVRLWEQARAKDVEAIHVVTVRIFEAGDAFRLLGAIGAVSGAEKIVSIAGGYETRDGGSFELKFRGPVLDAQPVWEFLEPQLRDASSRNLEAGFELTFEDGLSMEGDAAEKLTERLSRFATGAAYVSATAEARG